MGLVSLYRSFLFPNFQDQVFILRDIASPKHDPGVPSLYIQSPRRRFSRLGFQYVGVKAATLGVQGRDLVSSLRIAPGKISPSLKVCTTTTTTPPYTLPVG